jgi:peptidoglycan/xylan/chitin deacetylase (PgdA/CDA1 family)
MGHEIGNHTWSHHFNIGSLRPPQIRSEIERAHNRISEVTGIEPTGFVCPAWATSPAVLDVLKRLRYTYDTSTFPSAVLYPMVAKIALNHRSTPRKALRMLQRRDWHGPLTAPLVPYMSDDLVIMPLPTLGRLSPALWHTIGFMFGWQRCFDGMRRLLKSHPGFYYLIHPGDFLAPNEQHPTFRHNLARMSVPIAEKMARMEQALDILRQSRRPLVTLKDAALFHRARLKAAQRQSKSSSTIMRPSAPDTAPVIAPDVAEFPPAPTA